jgi:hypothetical protein
MEHLKLYTKWATTGLLHGRHGKDDGILSTPRRVLPELESPLQSINTKRRRLSLPEAGFGVSRVNEEVPPQEDLGVVFVNVAEDCSVEWPMHDRLRNTAFREQVLTHLERKITPGREPTTWGELNDQVMHTPLSRARHPRTEGSESEKEAHFLTGEEAERRYQPNIDL